MASGFQDAVVVVAGGGRGIGRAVATRFAGEGARVIVADTNLLPTATNQYRSTETTGYQAAQELCEALTRGGASAEAVACDVQSEQQVDALFERISTQRGRLDVVVNAFGITHVSTVEQMTLADFNAVVQGNLTGVFLMTRRAIPLLRSTGGGAIVNFSSVSGKKGFSKVAHYCAAKFGVIGFTSSVALEVAKWNIRVNAVCPGIVKTAMWEFLLAEFRRSGETAEECWARMCAMVPEGKPQTPEIIADAVFMLASCKSITGQALSVDGGMTA